MHVKEGIESSKIEIKKEAGSSTELLWVAILGPKSTLVLRTCYCPPD